MRKRRIQTTTNAWACITLCLTMMGFAQTEDAFKPRNHYGAKFELKSTVLHGGGQSPDAFEKYVNTLKPDQKPVLFMTYCGLQGNFEAKFTRFEKAAWPSLMPQIGLSLKGKSPKTGKNGAIDGEIAQGLLDDRIEAFCLTLKDLDRPCYIRIGYEFEGKWNGYSPESYKQTFIRITKALRKHEVKAATVWCCAGASSGASMGQLMKFYPGDEWVDWWGIDLFNSKEMNSSKTATFLEHAHKHKKPVMIGESTPRFVGVNKGGGQKSWDQWFQPYFKLIRDNPGIKAFCYINWDWKAESARLKQSWGNWGDARIEQNNVVAENYRKEMSLPLYQHAPAPDQ